jgi:transposase
MQSKAFRMSLLSLLVPLANVELETIHVADNRVTIVARSTQPVGTCPSCHALSSRVHSRYTRTVAGLPCVGRALTISLQVRRFFCEAPHCTHRTFAERFGTLLPPYARRLSRLADALVALAFATGGEGGARLAHTLAMPVSPRTLLRLLHAQAVAPAPAPRVVGLDEWTWKKGRNYGTLCVDLERRQPIDVLPDRSPDTIATWLAARPTIEIIARDRSGGFTDGATRGAPQATQVADRFHLLGNLRDALERCFLQKRSLLKQASQALIQQMRAVSGARPAPHGVGAGRSRVSEAASLERHAAAVELYYTIHDLRTKIVDIANIARQVGVSRRTVYRYLRMPEPPQRKQPYVGQVSRIEPYKPYLLQRWNDGCRSARQMCREITAQGYGYSESSVQRYVHQLRLETGTRNKFRRTQASQQYIVDSERRRPLTPGQLAWVCLMRPEHRQPWQTTYLTYLCQVDATIARACTQAHGFAEMARELQGDHLDQWLDEVQTTGVPELRAFAAGVHKDYAAVKAGLTLAYSNGQTEAQIQRLKVLKRQMFGKASFDLLRTRVLYQEQPQPIKRRTPKPPDLVAA